MTLIVIINLFYYQFVILGITLKREMVCKISSVKFEGRGGRRLIW